MKRFLWNYSFVFFITIVFLMGCSNRQAVRSSMPRYVNLENIQAGQFDTGKMWTFDFPPMDYFARTYNFTPSKEWFEKARLSTLRLPNCTASFVSEDGLVMTNHHCARSALDSVNREGERLAEVGFYAATLNDERKASGIFIDQSQYSIADSMRINFYPSTLTPEIEKQLLAYRLSIMERTLAGKDDAFDTLMAGRTPAQAAEELSTHSIIASKEKTQSLLAGKPEAILSSNDPFIAFVVAEQMHVKDLQKGYNTINEKIQACEQMLGNAMYEIFGTQIPPDATFTLRIADGIVKGYDYNGTIAPPVTTFYGLYDRYYSFGKRDPWNLSERWMNPPAAFKMTTPMNFVSTNDITGGNSGSPLINKNLEVVGLAFDGNIESLPGDIIFDDTKNRTVSVHSAGLLEGLEQIYNVERIVKELRAGKIVQ